MPRTEIVRLLLVSTLFGASLLAVLRAPEGRVLWYVAIVATEFGYFIAPFVLLLAIPWARPPVYTATVLAIGAAILFSSALARATRIGSSVGQAVSASWPAPPRTLPGAPASAHPLAASRLVHVPRGPFEARTEAYTAGQRAKIFVRPDAPTPRPLVVVVHGGSWANGDETQLEALNGYLAARGYAVVSVSYRFAPAHPYPAAVDDVVTAVKWARALPDVDASRTVLLGRSAGGHLALQAATVLGDVRGVVGLYPPSDLIWSWHHPTNPWVVDSPARLSDFLGGPLAERSAIYAEASPYFRSDRLPPVLILHGTRDELVFMEQSRRFAERLRTQGVRHQLIELPWATHGFDANLGGPGGQIATFAIERFLATVSD